MRDAITQPEPYANHAGQTDSPHESAQLPQTTAQRPAAYPAALQILRYATEPQREQRPTRNDPAAQRPATT